MEGHRAEIDSSLLKELRNKKFVRIIIEFFEPPENEQIEKIKDIGIKINHVFKVTPFASGSANSEQIEKVRKLPYVKKIWLDSTVKIC